MLAFCRIVMNWFFFCHRDEKLFCSECVIRLLQKLIFGSELLSRNCIHHNFVRSMVFTVFGAYMLQ